MNSNKETNEIIENDTLTAEVKKNPVSEAFDYLEIFVFAAAFVLLIFTFGIRLCTVDGNSMYDTLENKQKLVVSDIFYTPDNGDIIVFHQSDNANPNLNKPLVKRVIATEEQYCRIRYKFVPSADDNFIYHLTMEVWVSNDETFEESEKLNEDYIDYESLSIKSDFNSVLREYSYYLFSCEKTADGEYTFETKVPEGHVFVMGDNRFGSDDSRLNVGFVDNRCILGKVAFRLSPFGKVK